MGIYDIGVHIYLYNKWYIYENTYSYSFFVKLMKSMNYLRFSMKLWSFG
jgi:hypothetical protein